MEDNQLDKLVNRLIDDQGFAAQDADWNRFATFKDAEQKTKKPFLYKWILNSFLVLLIIGATYAYIQSKKQRNTLSTNIASTTSIDAANLATNSKPTKLYNQLMTENSILNESSVIINKNNSLNVQKIKPKELNKTIEKKQVKTAINNSPGTNTQSKPNLEKVLRKNFSQIFETPKTENKNNLKISSAINISNNNKIETEAINQKNEFENNNMFSKNNFETNIDLQKIAMQKSPIISNEIFNNKNVISSSSLKKVYINNYASIAATKQIINIQKTNQALEVPNIKIIDPIINQVNIKLQKIDMTDSEPLSNWQLYIQAGTSIQQGLAGNYGIRKSYSPTPYLSAEFDKQINAKTSVNIGLGYGYNNALNTQYQQLLSKYYFGRDTANFTIRHTHYHYLAIPLTVKYKVSNRIYANTGLGLTYMINAKSNLYDRVNGFRTAYGYGTGFNRTDAYFIAGIGVKLSAHFMAEAQYHAGLTDITKNAYFKNTITDKQSRINIGISYLIHKK